MAATITATPNPVYLPPGQASGTTHIKWDTDSDNRGRVFLSIDGGAEQLFDGGAQGKRQGQKDHPSIALGKTHVFRLRQANAAGTLLASVTVLAVKSAIIAPADTFKEAVLTIGNLYGAQMIHSVTIRPGLHDVGFSFDTTLSTVPIVEIYRDASESPAALVTAVFPIFAGKRSQHVLRIGDPPRLAQNTKFFFKIFAATPSPYKSPPAVLRGSFVTARQDASVIFDRIFVVRDGDPNSDGDMFFTFGVGDADTKERLFDLAERHREDLGDGDTAFVNKRMDVPNAPRRLWVEVRGEDEDRTIFAAPFDGLGIVGMLPTATGPMTGSWEATQSEGAWVWTELDTFEGGALTPGFREMPFSMATGNFGVAFHVHGRLQVTAFPQPAITGVTPFEFKTIATAAMKDLAVAGSGGGKAKMAALGPDGAIYVKTVGSGEPGRPRDQWTNLGGNFAEWLTAVATDEEHLDLFALDAEGGVHHKRHTDRRRPDGAWRRLGGAIVGPLAAALGPEGRIELFGADRDGIVHHATVEPGARRSERAEWQELGGGTAGAPAALQIPGAGLGLFALGRDGTVLHKRRHGRHWQPGTRRWDAIGGGFHGALAARSMEGGGVLLVVLTEDRMVHRLDWKNYPEGEPAPPWEQAGTLDEVLQSMLPAPERRREKRPRAKPDGAEPPRATPRPRPSAPPGASEAQASARRRSRRAGAAE